MSKLKLRKRFSKSPQPPFAKGGRGGITLLTAPLMKRTIYLKKKTLAEANEIVSSKLVSLIHLETETIPVAQSLDRVTAEPLFAKISSPPYHCAAMDGIAVRAETTYGATEESPRSLRINKEAFFVNTGNPIPPGMDAIIMIEDVHLIDSERVEIREAAYPW